MEHRRLLLACFLALSGVALAGCIEDLDRRTIEANWSAELDVDEAVFREVQGAPAMVVAEGTIEAPSDVNLTVTNIDGELTRENASIALQTVRVRSDEGTQGGDAEGSLELTAGEELAVTFVPADGALRRANPDHAWNASIEIQWRFRQGGSFDAGRLQLDENVTPSRVDGLGVGVVERKEGEVHGLVFEAIEVEDLPEEVEVQIFEAGGGSIERIDRVSASAEVSAGTARLALAENVTVPEGPGYLVFRWPDVGGTATTGLRTAEDPVPAAGSLALAALAAAAMWAAVRRRR